MIRDFNNLLSGFSYWSVMAALLICQPHCLASFSVRSNLPAKLNRQLQSMIEQQFTDPQRPSDDQLIKSTHELLSSHGYFSADCKIHQWINRASQHPNLKTEHLTPEEKISDQQSIYQTDNPPIPSKQYPTAVEMECLLGKPAMITRLSFVVEPNTSPEAIKLLSSFQTIKNQLLNTQFNSGTYQQAKSQLIDQARTDGFLEAHMEKSQVLVSKAHNTVVIEFVLTPGTRYRFADIQLSPKLYDPNFLKSFAPFKPGQAFRSELIQSYQEALRDTELFDQVFVAAQPTQKDDDRIYIQVDYVPQPRSKLGLQFGYDTDLGPFAALSNTLRQQAYKGAQLISFLSISPQSIKTSTEIRQPRNHPLRDFFKIMAGYTQQFKTSFEKNHHIMLDSSYTHISISESQRLEYNLGFNLGLYQTAVDTSQGWSGLLYPSTQLLIRRQLSHHLISQLQSQFQFSIQPLTPTRFFRTDNTLTTRYKVNANARFFHKLRLGYLNQSQTTPLPIQWYFHLGGMNNLRGIPYRGIGDMLDQIQAPHFISNQTLEYQHQVYPSIFAITYIDAGAIDPKPRLGTITSGFGVVWESPLGNIELSIAKPVKSPIVDSDQWRLGINLSHQI